VNRLEDQTKVCQTGRYARIASASPHFGEENCLRGRHGSGTIFFSQCNLRCVFCQNWDISQNSEGQPYPPARMAELMMWLQSQGCHNINFVTPGHVVPQVLEAVAEAIPRGLRVPLVYNTSAYDSLASLRLLDGIVDIYMPDFKFWSPETAKRLAKAPDYPQRARAAIAEMHRQVGPLTFGPDGVARRGVLVRHLVMPGQQDESAAIFEWLARELSRDTFVNIMAQYHPSYEVGRRERDGSVKYAEIDRRLRLEELAGAHAAATQAGLWRFDQR
jgi:putative pyruvate formate lyase activating enzyme